MSLPHSCWSKEPKESTDANIATHFTKRAKMMQGLVKKLPGLGFSENIEKCLSDLHANIKAGKIDILFRRKI